MSRWQVRKEEEAGEHVLGGSFSHPCALASLSAVFLGETAHGVGCSCPFVESSSNGATLQHTRYCPINKNIPCFQECALEEAWISREGLRGAEYWILP